MTPTEELQSKGFVLNPADGQLYAPGHYRVQNATTHIRAGAEEDRQADILTDSPRQVAVVERHLGDGTVGQIQVQAGVGRKFFVRVTAIRSRLIDEDNLAEKYHVDLLRYASGGAFGDSPATTHIEVRQEKAGKGEREEVRLEVFEL